MNFRGQRKMHHPYSDPPVRPAGTARGPGLRAPVLYRPPVACWAAWRAACRAASGPASTRSIFFLFGITSNTLARSIRFIRACLRRIRRLWAGTRSCGPGPQVYDYRGRGAPSHHLGRIHPYVLSCSAIGTDRERGDCVWNH